MFLFYINDSQSAFLMRYLAQFKQMIPRYFLSRTRKPFSIALILFTCGQQNRYDEYFLFKKIIICIGRIQPWFIILFETKKLNTTNPVLEPGVVYSDSFTLKNILMT